MGIMASFTIVTLPHLPPTANPHLPPGHRVEITGVTSAVASHSDADSRALPLPRHVNPELLHRGRGAFVQEIALVSIRTLFPIVILLAYLHPMNHPRIIAPATATVAPLLLSDQLLPIRRRLAQILGSMSKCAAVAVPTSSLREFGADSSLVEYVTRPFIDRSICLIRPRIHLLERNEIRCVFRSSRLLGLVEL